MDDEFWSVSVGASVLALPLTSVLSLGEQLHQRMVKFVALSIVDNKHDTHCMGSSWWLNEMAHAKHSEQ